MKKIIILLIVFAFSFHAKAQWKKVRGNGNVINSSRTVPAYDKIGVSGSFDVKLISGKEGELTIKAEENLIDYLITEVKEGHLKIKWKKGINIKTSKKILITIPFETIEEVALSGSGDIFSDDLIEANNFKLALSGAGDINLKLKVNTLKSAISGSGDINLSGSSTDFECKISGSGDIKAYELVSATADIHIAGSAGVEVDVTELLKVRVSGSGNVKYKSNPKKQDVKISGSGSVRSL